MNTIKDFRITRFVVGLLSSLVMLPGLNAASMVVAKDTAATAAAATAITPALGVPPALTAIATDLAALDGVVNDEVVALDARLNDELVKKIGRSAGQVGTGNSALIESVSELDGDVCVWIRNYAL